MGRGCLYQSLESVWPRCGYRGTGLEPALASVDLRSDWSCAVFRLLHVSVFIFGVIILVLNYFFQRSFLPYFYNLKESHCAIENLTLT